MRRLPLAHVLWLLLIFAANAQTPQVSQADTATSEDAAAPPTVRNYLLVDKSKSMGYALADGSLPRDHADRAVALKLDLLREAGEEASINFFSVEARRECDAPVHIQPQQPIPNVAPQSASSSGFTNLGAALDATLDDAGGGPARITIYSDQGQSEECGFHVCTVAAERLPHLPSIVVEQIWTDGNRETRANPFPCIDNARPNQDRGDNQTQLAAPSPPPAGDDEIDAPYAFPGLQRGAAEFLEHWLWLLAFAMIAWSAGAIGNKFGGRSRPLEKDSQEIREARQTVLLDSNPESAQRLLGLVNGKEADAVERKHSTSQTKASTWFKLSRWGVAGVALLSAIAFLPPWEDEVLSWKAVKENAWNVLGSEFSGGFAVLAIAVIFFASRQLNRFAEASDDFEIATREARKVAEARESESLRNLKEDHARSVEQFRSSPVREPWTPSLSRSNRPRPESHAWFKHACQLLKEQLVTTNELSLKDTPDKIYRKTQQLRSLMARDWIGRPPRIEDLLDAVSAGPSGKIPEGSIDELRSNLGYYSNARTGRALRTFLDAQPQQSGETEARSNPN